MVLLGDDPTGRKGGRLGQGRRRKDQGGTGHVYTGGEIQTFLCVDVLVHPAAFVFLCGELI